MGRFDILRSEFDKSKKGIEVAPWFNPIAAKRDGYNVRVLDVFDRTTLQERGRADPALVSYDMDLLEEVDFIGSATEIATLVPLDQHGTFDYITSSHNFEHLANPLKFLQGCEALLRPGGVISMAVPDRRACFDYFRTHTVISDWIDAFMEDRSQPSPRTVFEALSRIAAFHYLGNVRSAFSVGVSPQSVVTCNDLQTQLSRWRAASEGDGYLDVHCTVMTPASLELLLYEARHLGFIGLEVDHISPTKRCEFFVLLRKGKTDQGRSTEDSQSEANEHRSVLMRRMLKEYRLQSTGSRRRSGLVLITSRLVQSLGRRLRGAPDN